MLKLLAAAGLVGFFAQQASPGGTLDWTTVVAAYGVAAPLVLYVIVDNRRKDNLITSLQARNEALSDAAIEKFSPLTVEATGALREATQEIKALQTERERLIEERRRLPADVADRLIKALERLEKNE